MPPILSVSAFNHKSTSIWHHTLLVMQTLLLNSSNLFSSITLLPYHIHLSRKSHINLACKSRIHHSSKSHIHLSCKFIPNPPSMQIYSCITGKWYQIKPQSQTNKTACTGKTCLFCCIPTIFLSSGMHAVLVLLYDVLNF